MPVTIIVLMFVSYVCFCTRIENYLLNLQCIFPPATPWLGPKNQDIPMLSFESLVKAMQAGKFVHIFLPNQ